MEFPLDGRKRSFFESEKELSGMGEPADNGRFLPSNGKYLPWGGSTERAAKVFMYFLQYFIEFSSERK